MGVLPTTHSLGVIRTQRVRKRDQGDEIWGLGFLEPPQNDGVIRLEADHYPGYYEALSRAWGALLKLSLRLRKSALFESWKFALAVAVANAAKMGRVEMTKSKFG